MAANGRLYTFGISGILSCFDATTGRGINPPGARLVQYELKVDGDDVYVDPEAEVAP